MEKNFEEIDKLYVSLIQNTPFIDDLILAFSRNDKYFTDSNRLKIDLLHRGSRHQKCRRFYDWLLQEYPKVKLTDTLDQDEQLWKNFHNSGNAAAIETLQLILCKQKKLTASRVGSPVYDGIDWTPKRDIPGFQNLAGTMDSDNNIIVMNRFSDVREPVCRIQRHEQFNFTVACRAARVGDVDLLSAQLDACSNGDTSPITESDWSSKTLLHNIVDQGLKHPNQVRCIDILLDFAEKYHKKNELLDAKDLLNGETALHLAIKRESVILCRKLLCEGADPLITNRSGKSCLEVLYDKLPKVVEYLLDKSVATSGDTTGDLFTLSLDLGTVTGYKDSIAIVGENVSDDENSKDTSVEAFVNKKSTCRRKCSQRHQKLSKDSQSVGLNLLSSNESEEGENAKYPIVDKSLHCLTDSEKQQGWMKIPGEMGMLVNLIYTSPQSSPIILSHPVVKTFLDLKWKKMKNIFRLATFLQIFYCLLFMAVVYHIYLGKCPHIKRKKEEICEWSPFDHSAVSILLLSNTVYFLKEAFEARKISAIQGFKMYLYGFENVAQIIFVILVFVIALPVYLQNCIHPLQYDIAACGILLASILIVMVIGDSNQNYIIHSSYVHVYGVIMKRFLTVLVTFSAVLGAFALAFSIIFGKSVLIFATLPGSIGKIFMMLAGEFSFDEMFYKESENPQEGKSQDSTMVLGQLLFICFVAFVTIVLIDVFLGYTISDIQDLKKRGEEMWRCVQVEQLFIMESFSLGLSEAVTKYFSPKCKFLDWIDARVVIPKRRTIQINMSQAELTSYSVLVPFKDLKPLVQQEFREILIRE